MSGSNWRPPVWVRVPHGTVALDGEPTPYPIILLQWKGLHLERGLCLTALPMHVHASYTTANKHQQLLMLTCELSI